MEHQPEEQRHLRGDDHQQYHSKDEKESPRNPNVNTGHQSLNEQETAMQLKQNAGATQEELLLLQKKTSVLQAENRRIKQKLSKAKTLNETLTAKHNSVHESLKVMEDRLTQQIEITSALRGELDDIRRNQDKVDKSDVKEILARVKVAGSGYTLLLEKSGKTVWHAD